MNLAFRRWLYVGLGGLVLWLGGACTQSPTGPVSSTNPISQASPIRSNAPSVTLWQSYQEAGLLATAGRHDAEAEQHFQAALREAEGFGPTNPRLALSLSSLSEVYWRQGRYTEAEPLARRAVAISEKTLGPDDLDAAVSVLVLAMIYRDQSRYVEAEPLFHRALGMYEKALGPNHSGLFVPLDNYAILLRKTNRPTEAAALEARSKALAEIAYRNGERFLDQYDPQRQGRPKVP